jgi:hypothetical protein
MMSDNSNESLRIHLEVIRLSLRHTEEKLFEKTQEYERVLASMRMQDGKYIRTIEELNALNERYVRLEERFGALEKELQQAELKLSQKERNIAKKKASVILQAILIDILFLLSTVLASFGVNMLTSTTPNQVGWIAIALAVGTYFVAATIGVVRTFEGVE